MTLLSPEGPAGGTGRVGRSFQRWIDNQDPAAARAATDLSTWASTCIFILILLWATTATQGARDFFHMKPWLAFRCFLPLLLMLVAFRVARRGRSDFGKAAWILLLVGTAVVQFFAASLVTCSSGSGALLFASLFIWACGYHGHLLRVTLTEPLLAIGTVLAGIAAFLLNPDLAHSAIFSLAIPAGIVTELSAGTIAVRRLRIITEADNLRAAVAAQILDQQDAEVRRISQTLVDVLARNHDVNNALMSACLDAEEIAESLESRPGDAALSTVAQELRQSLEQIRLMLLEVREGGTTEVVMASGTAVVSVQPVLEAVASKIRARFPSVRLTLRDGSPGISAQVRGGAINLHRVVGNLLLNACEGNGKQHAGSVTASIHRSVTGASVEIRVEDDGPGFNPELLARSIEGFKTSKPHGTGLGLYTSERIVHASGGSLNRSNLSEGGASVVVMLPLGAA